MRPFIFPTLYSKQENREHFSTMKKKKNRIASMINTSDLDLLEDNRE